MAAPVSAVHDHHRGHADERGTREYNIALGARRATTVRNFLGSERRSSTIGSARSPTVRSGRWRSATTSHAGHRDRRAQTVLNNRAASRQRPRNDAGSAGGAVNGFWQQSLALLQVQTSRNAGDMRRSPASSVANRDVGHEKFWRHGRGQGPSRGVSDGFLVRRFAAALRAI